LEGDSNIWSDDQSAGDTWALPSLGLSIFIVIDIMHDIAVVDNHVRERNERIFLKNAGALKIAPAYFPDSGAGGLQLRVTF
jgi:hypothetical protein